MRDDLLYNPILSCTLTKKSTQQFLISGRVLWLIETASLPSRAGKPVDPSGDKGFVWQDSDMDSV